MRLKDAVISLQPGKKNQRIVKKLATQWNEQGTADDREVPFTEYPRPQMERSSWVNLNGWWDYAIVPAGTPFRKAAACMSGKILVPFSPETDRSGVRRVLQPDEAIWYVRTIRSLRVPAKHRVLLHFGAVDERCKVWWNGQKVGAHRNGYLPFSFDVTPYIREGCNELRVYVRDDTDEGTACRGKQTLRPGGMFYQAQSGIWQTVWLEYVPDHYVQELKIVPSPERNTLMIQVGMNVPEPTEIEVDGRRVCYSETEFECSKSVPHLRCVDRQAGIEQETSGNQTGQSGRTDAGRKKRSTADRYVLTVELPAENPRLWTPESPVLYPLIIRAGDDRVKSYFAMRSFGKGVDADGHPCFTLNGAPYFLNGVLDQGYWPESLMTPPSEEAMIFDITQMKRLGFNMLRKHEKMEPDRWYYHCDRIGMVVWQDMVHGGGPINSMLLTYLPTVFPAIGKHLNDRHYRLFSRTDTAARKRFEQDLTRMIRQLGNHPCIGIWSLFNEGWGQFDALRLTERVRQEDPSRLIDHAGGWYDQGGGDMRSVHNYFRKLKVEKDSRPFVLSEYGGYSCSIAEHSMCDDTYGYHRCTEAEFPDAFKKIMGEIERLRGQGLAAAVYTQLSDVEEETNGLLTYDRKVCKI